jgi:multiple sugar transport system permease protein
VGNLFSCTLAAFAFARLRFALRRLWFALMLGTILLPFHVTIVPQYVLFHQLGWINTLLPLVVPKFLAVDAFFVFLLVQFIRTVRRELDEAAEIDGCGSFRLFYLIILPLIVPALATTAVFTFIWTWNDFFAQLLYLKGIDSFTVPVALRAFLDTTGVQQPGQLFAMSVLALVPTGHVLSSGCSYRSQGVNICSVYHAGAAPWSWRAGATSSLNTSRAT